MGFGGACGGGDPPPPTPHPPVPSTLTVNPSEVEVAERDTRQLTATLLDQRGQPIEAPIQWSSSNPLVAQVSDSGSVLGVARGQAMVRVRAQSVAEVVTVTVVERLAVEISAAFVPADSVSPPGTDSITSCVYRIMSVVAGGAPGDSATWAPSAFEYLDDSGNLITVPVDSTGMLDRFGSLVMRRGDTLTSGPLRVTEGRGSIVNRLRYQVGAELRSVRLPIICP